MAEATQQTDEYGYALDEQDPAVEKAKTDQLIKLVAASNQQINQLPNTLPTIPATPPSAPAIVPPRNRTYMGPNIGGPTNPQEFFGEYATQNRVFRPPTLAPPTLSPEQQGALQQRLTTGTQGESDAALLARMQAADRPGSHTIAVSRPPPTPPTMDDVRLEGMLQWKRNKEAGMADAENWAQVGPSILGRLPPRPVVTPTPRMQNVGGAGWVYDKTTGQFNQVTPTKPQKTTAPSAVVNRHKALLAAELVAKQGNNEENIKSATKERKDFEAEHPELGLTPKTATAAPAPTPTITPPVTPSAKGKNEVTRTTKEGRKAIFDSATKKFLRYAD